MDCGDRATLTTALPGCMRADKRRRRYKRKEREASIKVMGRYLQTDDREALDETYDQIALKVVPEKPYPTLAGIQTILDELAAKNPKARAARPEDFVDVSFLKKLDEEGFIDRLRK